MNADDGLKQPCTDDATMRQLGTVATIGFFDGVHAGHRYLLEQVKAVAAERGLPPLVVTFDCHPRQVLQRDYVPQLLTTLDEKLGILRHVGATHVEVLHFTEELSRLSARDFMRDVLCGQLGVRVLIMGYDHRFGHDGGTYADYVQWGREVGIEVLHADELLACKVSSSALRQLVSEGHVAEVAERLGRPYRLMGTVVHGSQVGRTIGFPTLNLQCPPEKLLPACGVYAVRALLSDGTAHSGMLCIGSRPTLDDGKAVSVEAHLFDYEGDLYGQCVALELIDYLRAEQKFPSLEALRQQLMEDAKHARARCK